MRKIKEAIVVEGRYDKNKLKQLVDAQVIETSGFGIFNNAEKRELLRKVSQKKGIIVLTDSDKAGFVIRNHLRGILPKENIKHAYVPQIEGKERRKAQKSKEGILGVEGMTPEIIMKALEKANATFLDCDVADGMYNQITKTDFYEDGLSGGQSSTVLREKLLRRLELPSHMTSNALLEAVNILLTRDEYCKIIDEIMGE